MLIQLRVSDTIECVGGNASDFLAVRNYLLHVVDKYLDKT